MILTVKLSAWPQTMSFGVETSYTVPQLWLLTFNKPHSFNKEIVTLTHSLKGKIFHLVLLSISIRYLSLKSSAVK